MKKTFLALFVGVLFISACDNNNSSSTIGTYEDDEATAVHKKEDPAKEPLHSNPEKTEMKVDTLNNLTGITMDSAGATDKKDTTYSHRKRHVKAQKTKGVDRK
jgi:hypothetical protein